MTWLLVLGVVAAVTWRHWRAVQAAGRRSGRWLATPFPFRTPAAPRPTTRPAPPPAPRPVFPPVRPRVRPSRPGAPRVVAEPVEAMRDALTGLPLDPRQPLWRCARCRAAYHADSRATLEAENGGNCLACGGAALQPVSPAWPPAPGTAPPAATAPARVDARVFWVGPAAEPGFLVALLEDRPWRQALKLVFPPSVTREAADARYITGLAGRTIVVVGRVNAEGPLGPRIVVTDLAAVSITRSDPARGVRAHAP